MARTGTDSEQYRQLAHEISEIFRKARPGRVIADIVDFILEREMALGTKMRFPTSKIFWHLHYFFLRQSERLVRISDICWKMHNLTR